MIAAMRAVPSTSPFLALPRAISSSVAFCMTTAPSATAMRSVAGFADTSTMRASPFAPICVSAGSLAERLSAIGLSCRARGLAREQRAGGGRHVRLSHQALADEEGGHARARELREIGRREDAALADGNAILRDQGRKLLAGCKRRLEGAQVAVVDAEQRGAKLQRAIEFGAIVHLEQHVHAERQARVLDVARNRIVERRHDDQDA